MKSQTTLERECDEQEYERRIAALTRAARKGAGKAKAATWSAALERLRTTDNYLCAILVGAELFPAPALSWRGVVAVLACVVGGGILSALAVGWYAEHSPTREALGFYLWAGALAGAAGYLAARWLFGAKRVDNAIGRVIDAVLRH